MTGDWSVDRDFWLVKPLDEAVQHFRHVEGRPVIIRQTRAPRKDQGSDGTWRVVKVQDDPEGIILTAAWQPPANALGSDAGLG